MKIQFILAALLLSTTITIAQNRISLKSDISFELPSGTVKFADTEHQKMMKEAFGEDFAKTLNKNTEVYKLDNIVFRFKVIEKVPPTYIQNINKAFRITYEGPSNFISSTNKMPLYRNYKKVTKKVGDGEVIYALYETEENAEMMFHYYAPLKNVAFTAEIIYPSTDLNHVIQVVDRLMETVIIVY